MKNLVFVFSIIAVFASSSLFARNYYVSAAGSNTNDGLTQATAWQTISKVNSSFASMAAGDSILFRRGDVFFGTLVIGRSGTSTLPMNIGAYGTGAKPVITGFYTVSSTAWTLVGNGVYQAPVPGAKASLNMVAINDVPQALGRYPNNTGENTGYLNYETFSGYTSITDNELDSLTSWVGAEVVIRKKLWVLDRCKVTAQSGKTITYTNTNSSTYTGTAGFGYFIQNDPRTLDKFGEWYFNGTTKNLQVYFGAAAPSSYTVKVSGLDTLLYISSKTYVNIENINFTGANANAFLGLNSSYINIRNCDFANSGVCAIDLATVGNLLIDNCTVNYSLSNGIDIASSRSSNITIRNSSVKNTGKLPGMGQSNGSSYKGILVSALSNLLVEYNRVDSTGYVGIEYQGSNVTIKNNVVNYFDFVKDDAGGIYTYSSGTDAAPGTVYTNRVVRDNIVMNGVGAPGGRNSNSPFVSGIYLDGRTMNVDVINNTVFNNGKNGIHCNNPNNVTIRGNTSFNNLNSMSVMRWASLGNISNLLIKSNTFYPKTIDQRTFYYGNSGMNEPAATTLAATLQSFGAIDSNYYSSINQAGFLQEIYTTTGGALIATSPLSFEGWRSVTSHDSVSKKASKSPVTYKVTGLVGANKFTNGQFTSAITGVTVFGTSTTGTWDNTGKISGGSLMVSFTAPSANKWSLVHSPIGAVSSAKHYVLRFSTYGTTQQGLVRAYIRKTTSPYTNLTPVQLKAFSSGRKDHEFLFSFPTTDAGGSFVIEIEQTSGTTYLDNIEFYEVTAQLYDFESQLRFEYNDTKLPKTVALDGRYTAVDGSVYTTSLTLQPFTSIILVKDTGTVALSTTTSATAIKCYGDSSTVTVTATGGIQPYTGTGTFKVRAGTYTYTVTDAAGATSSSTITISQPASALVVTATAGTISSSGGSTTITVGASGGTSPYTGAGTFTVSAGTYTYIVTDANGCTASVTKTVVDGAGPFALTVTASPSAGGTVTGAGTYASGTVVTLTATPAAGYAFSGWSGDVTGTSSTITVTMSSNKSVTATFAPVVYTVNASSSPVAGGSVSGTGTYSYGSTATLTATPAAGYVFSGWSGSVTGSTNPVSVTVTGNVSVTATFTQVTYTLTATASPTAGGTVSGAGTYGSGSTATLTATPASGYVFSGWSGAVTGTVTSVTVTMDANKTVTANFVPATITYTLTATASPTAGGTITGGGTYASGSTATLTATPATGYVFSGWSGGVTGTANPVTVSMTSNVSVTATFTRVTTYVLTTASSPTTGGTVTGAGTYTSGTVVTVTAVPAAGYAFSIWSGTANTANPVSVTMSSNRAMTAVFVPVTYTLTATASPSAGGTVTGSGTYSYGATATLTAVAASGYTFTGWSGDTSSTSATITMPMYSNKTVTATFALVSYTLTTTATPAAGGTISGGGAYTSGSTATLTATPAAGYSFSGWSGAVTGTTNPVTVSMTGNKSVTATFTQITYTLATTASPTAGGTITGGGSYGSGSTATLTATPAAGYTFSGWSGAATGTTNPVTVSMTGDKSVTATFTQITYTLTSTASPTAGGTITGGGTYTSGSTATLTATPAAGYTFSGWSGAVTGSTNPVTVSMTGDKSVTATFTQVTYVLTTASSPAAGGTVTGAGTYTSGTVVTVTAIPAAGYVFTGWSGTASTANPVSVTMSANRVMTALFTLANYTLTTTASPVAGGTITGAGTYASGSTATLTATPAAGYTFTGWSGDVTATTNPVSVVMSSNKAVTATFIANTTLRIEDDVIGTSGLCSIDGTISNNSGANNGRSVNLTNSAAKGLNWSVDAGATGTYTLKWRYANGSTSNTFFMRLIINGVVVEDSVPFPRTTGSSTFTTTSGDFPLTAGNNTIRLESIAARATADIDWMEITGYAPAIGSCLVARTATTTTTSDNTVTARQATGVYPNPANGNINIGFDLPATQKVSFVILDAAGNPVAQPVGKVFPAGHNVQQHNMMGKAAGIYTVIVNGEKNYRQAYKFIVIQ